MPPPSGLLLSSDPYAPYPHATLLIPPVPPLCPPTARPPPRQAPALAVMCPLLIKGLKEETAIKRKAANIISNMSKLVTVPAGGAGKHDVLGTTLIVVV